jgi:ubiquinol-cytochrome c reductase cytochrome c subunit
MVAPVRTSPARSRPSPGISLVLLCLGALSSQIALGQAAKGASPDGKAIFLSRCAKCHGPKGEGISAAITIAGPSLQAEHNPGMVMTAMEVGPSHMPNFSYLLSVPDMHAVAAYVTQKLAVLPLSGSDLAQGGKLFREYCAPCHRTAVRGGALAFTGINAPALTGKSAALIAGAIRWGPGPMPSFPSSVLSDQQVASIAAYIRLVQQPPSPGGSPMNWYGPVAEGFAAWVIVFGLVGIAGWIEKGGKG